MSRRIPSYGELALIIETLPTLIHEKRRARGLSLRATALEVGCSFSTVQRAERGDGIITDNLWLILRWLDEREERP